MRGAGVMVMRRGQAFLVTLVCVVGGHRVLAQSHEMMMHHGVPSRVMTGQRVGPYIASVWVERDVGVGAVYVMLDAANGLAFAPPSAVRVAIAPTSGRVGEVVHEAHAEAVHSGGGRYVTSVMFDRAERWNVRVSVEGPAGGGQLVSQVESTSNAEFGLLGVSVASIPFVLVAFVYWRSSMARRRQTLAFSPDPRLTRPQLD